ncbi:ER lumen protein-retaining receptor [Durusdinium trenchii]|uniref:ER lumen protein-retaining receptor n=1 Tax=Durusdinium trenchii TaxID=1381693 RepID=A0ABP0J8Z8_9DINO
MERVKDVVDSLRNPGRRKEFVQRNRLNIILYVTGGALVLFVYHVLSDGDFSFLLTLGSLTRFFAFLMLVVKFRTEKLCNGVSLKTLELYAIVFAARLCSILFYEGYLPFDSSGDWLYQVVEVLSLITVGFLIFTVAVTFKSSYNANEDGFGKIKGIPTQFGPVVLIGPCLVLAILLHPSLNRNFFTDIAWTFALYLETVAILPQFYMLQKSNRAVEPWVSHFVFAIGLSRMFSFVFWASSYHELSDKHSIGITGGWVGLFVLFCQLVHIVVMGEFCYHYLKSAVEQSPLVLPGLQVLRLRASRARPGKRLRESPVSFGGEQIAIPKSLAMRLSRRRLAAGCPRWRVRALSTSATREGQGIAPLMREAGLDERLAALKTASRSLRVLQASLDEHVVGHKDVKRAMLLGLLAKEHVYVEGQPGIAKTLMSEIISQSTGLEPFFHQMHRDTRLAELVGESIVVRSRDESSGGEVIRQDILPGGILTAEIAILDDISRAPGEALNVLLRILNERKFGNSSERLPLFSAIASSNPASDDAYFAEPLDPANLDRFTLQIKADGLIQSGDWEAAERVIDMYGLSQADVEDMEVRSIGREAVLTACGLVPHVLLGEPPKQALLSLLRVLRNDYNLDESNSLLSDRAFLVKAVRILKANAVLSGRYFCEPEDLRVLRFLTTFRVPAHVHEQIEDIIERVLAELQPEDRPPNPPPNDPDATGSRPGAGTPTPAPEGGGEPEQDQDAPKNPTARPPQPPQSSDSEGPSGAQQGDPDEEHVTRDDPFAGPPQPPSGGRESDVNKETPDTDRHEESSTRQSPKGPQQQASRDRNEEQQAAGGAEDRADDNHDSEERRANPEQDTSSMGNTSSKNRRLRQIVDTHNVEPLMRCLRGRIERGAANELPHDGGQPRGWAAGRSMHELVDFDATELAMWFDVPSPRLPRSQRRSRIGGGGRLAIVRDTSSSMEGLWADWSSLVCARVLELARRNRMRVGYVEFDTKASKFVGENGAFFSRNYDELLARSSRVACQGNTNYERALRTTLLEFERASAISGRSGRALALNREGNEQHILFITDGRPTAGDKSVRRQIQAAKAQGVSAHTIFIGYERCPAALDEISNETKGSRFAAFYDSTKEGVVLVDRRQVDENKEFFDTRGAAGAELHKLNRLSKIPSLFQTYVAAQD